MLAQIKTLVAIMSELYQLFYEDNQKKEIFDFAIPYKTEGLTIFFEGYWIAQLVMASKADKVGVCSWKLKDKMRKRVGLRQPLTQQALESDYQVLRFTKTM
jgi:hypothetical protein